MRRSLNITGASIAKQRHERGWTQTDLEAKLQCVGAVITRQKLANIECGRTQVPDELLPHLQTVFELRLIRFFPKAVQELEEKLAERERRLALPTDRQLNQRR